MRNKCFHPPLIATGLAGALLAGASLAQSPPLQRTWSRTYGGSSSEQGLLAVKQIPGGRLVVAGYSASFGGPRQSNWLMNLGLGEGNVIFEHTNSTAFGGFTDGAAIAADAGALFMGRDVLDVFLKHDAWLVRVDSGGAVVWSQGFTRQGWGRHFLFDAAELADGSWIAVGATSILDQPPQAAWIVRLSATGALIWQYEYNGGLVETARSVVPTADGGFAVAGSSTSSGAGSEDVWVMKIDAAGVIQWQKTLGGADNDQAEQIIELDDGSFAVAGFTNSLTPSGHAPWLLRLASNGALLWHKVVADDVWGDLGALAKTNDGKLIVVGRVAQSGFPSNDLWCAKFAAADGKVSWQTAYEGDSGDFGSVVLPMTGSSFILGGTWGWGFPQESIWLQRVDRRGGLNGCGLARATDFSTPSPTVTVLDAISSRAPGGAQTQPVAVLLAPSAAVVTDRCP